MNEVEQDLINSINDYDNSDEIYMNHREEIRQKITEKRESLTSLINKKVKEYLSKRNFNSEFQDPNIGTKIISGLYYRDKEKNNGLNPELIDEYTNYYKTTIGKRPTGSPLEIDRNLLNLSNPNNYELNDTIVPDFTVENIKKVLGKFKRNKAAGPDGLPIEVYLDSSDTLLKILSLLFKSFYKYSIIPKEFSKINIHPIYKNANDVNDIGNYRPISLTNTLRRIYERIINQCFYNLIESHINHSQVGFMTDKSTSNHLFCLQEVYLSNKPTAVFLDIQAAYDSIPREIMYTQLCKMLPNNIKLIQIIRSLFDFNESSLVIKGKKGNSIKNSCGLIQGSVLAPILFNVFINSLAVKLTEIPSQINLAGTNINCLLYADDIVLLGKTKAHLQRLLKICETWSIRFGITFAIHKCAVILSNDLENWELLGLLDLFNMNNLQINNNNHNNHHLYLYNRIVPEVSNYKYLGIPFCNQGVNFDLLLTKTKNLIKYHVAWLCSKNISNTWYSRSTEIIIKLFIMSRAEYGIGSIKFPKSYVNELAKCIRGGMKRLLGIPRSTSNFGTLIFTNMIPFHLRIEELQAKFIFKLKNLKEKYPKNFAVKISNYYLINEFSNNYSSLLILKVKNSNTFKTLIDNSLNINIHKKLEISRTLNFSKLLITKPKNIAGTIAGIKENQTLLDYYQIRRPPIFKVKTDRGKLSLIKKWMLGVLTHHQKCNHCPFPLNRERATICCNLKLPDITYCRNAIDDYLFKFRKKIPSKVEFNKAYEMIKKVVIKCLPTPRTI